MVDHFGRQSTPFYARIDYMRHASVMHSLSLSLNVTFLLGSWIASSVDRFALIHPHFVEEGREKERRERGEIFRLCSTPDPIRSFTAAAAENTGKIAESARMGMGVASNLEEKASVLMGR